MGEQGKPTDVYACLVMYAVRWCLL